MKREDLLNLSSNGKYPAISILMPTHRSFPENKQDKIRLKNLVDTAKQRLSKEFTGKELNGLLNKLDQTADSVDLNNALDGLAVFVNHEYEKALTFPFPVEERVIIDKTFAARDLVFAYNRTQPYLIAVINEKHTYMYSAERDKVDEIKHRSLPVDNPVHELRESDPGDTPYDEKMIVNEERFKNYLRSIDKVIRELRGNENTGVILTGTERQLAFFRNLTRTPQMILGTIKGSYENLSTAELARLVWPVAKEEFAKKRKEVLGEADNAIKSKKFAQGIDEVWKLAHEGRGLVLLTETNFSCPAIKGNNGELIPAENSAEQNVIDDAVDEIIEAVINKDGRVVFFNNGELSGYNRIAMILRY